MAGPRVHAIIVNWRTAELTLAAAAACLRAMEGLEGALTLVDNASGDGSEARLRAGVAAHGWQGRVRVLQAGRNGGYGAGNNAAIRAGLPDGRRADFVYVLNPDAAPAPDALRALLARMAARPATGLAGSLIHGPAGDWHATAFRFPSVASEMEGAARLGPVSRLLRGRAVPLPRPDSTGPVDWVAGASLLLRADMLDAVGLFDEGFFLYFEETDLCRRARAAGWITEYVVESRVAHEGSASTGMKTWRRTPGYWFASRRRYFVRHHGAAGAAAATLAHLAGGALWRARRLLTGAPPLDPPGFLRDLALSDLRALLHALVPGARRGTGVPAGPITQTEDRP